MSIIIYVRNSIELLCKSSFKTQMLFVATHKAAAYPSFTFRFGSVSDLAKKKEQKPKIKLTIYNNKKRPSLILDFVLNSNAPCKFVHSFFLGTFQLFLCYHRIGQILASFFGRFYVRFPFIYEQFTYLALPRNIVLLYFCSSVSRYEKLIECYVFE